MCVGGQCQCQHEDVLLQGVPADGGVACRCLAEEAVILKQCRGGVVVEQHREYGLIFLYLVPGFQPGVLVLDRAVNGSAVSAPILRGRTRKGGCGS